METFQHIDRIVHEPSRLLILVYLYSVEKADFTFLKRQTGMTQGNLASHLARLESAGYIKSVKMFRERKPLTMLNITGKGREAFTGYVGQMHQLISDLRTMVG